MKASLLSMLSRILKNVLSIVVFAVPGSRCMNAIETGYVIFMQKSY